MENRPYNARILVIYIVQVQSVIEMFGKQVNNALNMHYHKKTTKSQTRILSVFSPYNASNMRQHIVFLFLRFCTFFKIFHVRLGKKRKNVSFYRRVCMCKAKLTFVSFFSPFFLHLSLMRLSCCHFVFSESLNFNYLFGTEPHVHETFQRDNDDDVHG